jgi:hypothetical protein
MSDVMRQWLRLAWPYEVSVEQVQAALLALHGMSTPRRRDALVLMVSGTSQGLQHHLAVAVERAPGVSSRLRQAVPGLSVESAAAPTMNYSSRWTVWLSTRRRPLRTMTPEVIAQGLLSALGNAHRGEGLALLWVLGPVRRPLAIPTVAKAHYGEPLRELAGAVLDAGRPLDNERRTALVHKVGEPGWRAAGLIGVRAGSRDRQRQLLAQVASALRSAQGPGVRLGAQRRLLPGDRLPWRRPLAFNIQELTGLAAWPLGELEGLPIDRVAARRVAPIRALPRQGRVIGTGAYPGHTRPIALSVRDSLSHVWIAGPTGSGKSSLLTALAEGDLQAGRSIVVIDPKGDLIDAILARVPADRARDVVVVDAADDVRPVGLNPLDTARRQPELVADQLFNLFRSLSGESWGPRIADVMQAGLLTLAQIPETSLCHLPVLLADRRYRRRVVAQLDDPFGLAPFWAYFEALSDSERQQTVAPVMRRLRQLLLSPRMRAVLGQVHPRFSLDQALVEPKVVLVNLSKGILGPEASSLLGSLVVHQLWQAVLARTAVPQAARQPVMVFIDEVQDQLHGITDIGDMLAQARGLGVGLHLAHQHLGQVDADLRSALAANARSRVIFQTSADDAAYFVRGQSVLRVDDFRRLPAFEAYASLLADGQVTPYTSVRTLPPSTPSNDPEQLRARSRAAYGVDRQVVEADVRRLLSPDEGPASSHRETPLGAKRRPT